ncbi:NAD(P)/FAD-dependent oxidoreductase [Bacteriovorax stolpii]|uniref:Phytoene dehydrogenase n=1 Tax=Bacteriovorax stolpii TaxID=960 RepID=A0A2K9NRJ3_BACTC|nr:FAD-dependent oxidoreductase [Bacteriovorax stolpii]AUN98133.1 phytoene dehydrogenase [Bacteriovorax stolpii]QDK41887.1 NAD(P)/FAD-dependent oxidoreductase [Bacteriovorax stolpii]TDP52046.1 phytoene dehydrogenase-like protein [Bacteriovorax stolpii]
MNTTEKVDCVVIGAGMSGLAAGIRLAMYNKKVLVLEKHTISGGLNSYYARGKRKFDVGLHALTNFVTPSDRGKPFNKLMKQLRIPYEEFKLSPQNYSLIQFPDKSLKFTNEINVLIEEINQNFPQEIDGFIRLLEHIKNFDEVNLNNETVMAKTVVRTFIKNDSLVEMIFCPLLIYGSAWENDMDFSQFVIMFKSIFLEGFSRPEGGVRTIIDLLLKKLSDVGGELRFKSEVTRIISHGGKVVGVEINHNQIIECSQILSSMGLPETYGVVSEFENLDHPAVGQLSFCESILVTDKKPRELGVDATIIFYNNRPEYLYQKPQTLFDRESAVVCFPNNFKYDNYQDDYPEGVLRITNIANFDLWNELKSAEDKTLYKEQKEILCENAKGILKNCGINPDYQILFKDIFTPTTIKRYTQHFEGTVYGSTDKSRNGKTPIDGLYICGTDQGFLGIVGSMLSGISMANLHVLQGDFK